MGCFDEHEDADYSNAKEFKGQGNYFGAGNYIVEVLDARDHKGYKGKSIIIDMEVLWASDGSENEVEDAASHIIKPDKPGFLGDVMNFMSAVYGQEPGEANNDVWTDRLAKVFPLSGQHAKGAKKKSKAKGVVLKLKTTVVPTKAGGQFTQHRYSTVNDEELAAKGLA